MQKKLKKARRGSIAVDQILVIAASLIVVGLIMIPGLKTLGGTVVEQLQTWWDTMSTTIFAA